MILTSPFLLRGHFIKLLTKGLDSEGACPEFNINALGFKGRFLEYPLYHNILDFCLNCRSTWEQGN